MDVKWIKISTLMFDDEKIKIIESMPDADTILIIWVKLLVQAGKTNASGYIYLSENIPYTEEMLATIFNRPLSSVRFALETFRQLGMVETEGSFITISNWEKHQNIDGMERIKEQNRIRKQRERENKRLKSPETKRDGTKCQYCGEEASGFDHIIPISKGGLDESNNKVPCCKRCNNEKTTLDLVTFLNYKKDDYISKKIVLSNEILSKLVDFNGKYYTSRDVSQVVTQSHATDIEEDIELDIDKERDIKQQQVCQSLSFFSTQFNLLPSPFMVEHLTRLVDEYTDEWTLKALEEALLNNNRKLTYVEGILKNWKQNGSDTPWKAEKKPTQQTKQGKPQIPTVQNQTGQAVSQERLQELLKLADKLDGGN